MAWKDLKPWLKGGIIWGIIFGLLALIRVISYFADWELLFSIVSWILYLPLSIATKFGKSEVLLVFILPIIFGFVIGTIIGLIIQKVRK